MLHRIGFTLFIVGMFGAFVALSITGLLLVGAPLWARAIIVCVLLGFVCIVADGLREVWR